MKPLTPRLTPAWSNPRTFAVAEATAQAGAEVIIASSSQQLVEAALKRLPVGLRGEPLDVTDEAQVGASFAPVGAFDHLVYTADEALLLENLADLSVADTQRAFEVRYWSALKAVMYGALLPTS